MKVCHLCGESYKDCVDFCFNDGEVLQAVGAAGEQQPDGLDAPVAPRLVQGGQQAYGAPVTQPVTRPRRAAPSSQPEGAVRTAAKPVPAPNLAEGHASDAPPAAGAATPPHAPELDDDAEDDGDEATLPPSSVDTAPLLRPNALRPQQTPTPSPMSTAATPALASSRSPAPAPRTESPTTAPPPAPPQAMSTLLPRTMTFDGDEDGEQNTPSLVMLGVGAAVLGLCFVVGAGAVLVGMSAGMFGPQDPVANLVEPIEDPVPAISPPQPVEAPGSVQPEPEAPEPVQPEPEAPEPVQPEAPEPVQPEPEAPEPVQPEPEARTQPPPQLSVDPTPPPRRPQPITQPSPANDAVADASLQVIKTKVTFRSEPTDAVVVIDGQELGKTPFSTMLEPNRSHDYELRLPGFQPYRDSVQPRGASLEQPRVKLIPVAVVAAEPASATSALMQPEEPRRGPILVFASGFAKAELSMDGMVVGALPARLPDVREGSHEFVIRTAEGQEISVSHDVSFDGRTSDDPVHVYLVP